MGDTLRKLERDIVSCGLCPRLREHCQEVARIKRRAFRDEDYWGNPVPGFGDPQARVYILGLAPAAHGANRTGRVFTGDKSGDWLYRALYDSGFANQPQSVGRNDGLKLTGVWIGAAARCAPPGNKPAPDEFDNCRKYLKRELALLTNVKVTIALGRLAFDNLLDAFEVKRSARQFGHNVLHDLGSHLPLVITSYHPSQQNTSTGKLTRPMLDAIFTRARSILEDGNL